MKSRLHSVVAACLILLGFAFSAQAAIFEPLFKITSTKGDVMIVRPGSDQPVKALEAHAYPYGSRLIIPRWNPKSKTPKPEVSFSLSRDHRFRLSEHADLAVGNDSGGDLNKKVLTLKSGKLKTFIAISTVKTGGAEDEAVEAGIQALSIETPLAVCTRLTERNVVSVSSQGTTHTVMVVTESGMMEVEGPEFKIRSMRRNAEVEIFGDEDFTRILNNAADFTVELAKGVDAVESVLFRPRCVAKIWRSYAEIGGKQAVSVMIAFPDGLINSYAFMAGESVVVDSQFASSENVSEEAGENAVSADGTESLDEMSFPAEGVFAPTETGDEQTEAFGDTDAGGFNFDDWE